MFNLDDYEPVQDRLVKFYKKYSDGRIITKLTSEVNTDGYYMIKAAVYKSGEELKDNLPLATGWADESLGKGGMANKTAPLENCETSAIGRALANAGFSTSKSRASKEEMVKVATHDK